jgi:hypothetical protein
MVDVSDNRDVAEIHGLILLHQENRASPMFWAAVLFAGIKLREGRGVIDSRGKSGQGFVASGQVIATSCLKCRIKCEQPHCGSGSFAATLYSRKSSKNNASFAVWRTHFADDGNRFGASVG